MNLLVLCPDDWADPDKVPGLVAISPERNLLTLLLSGLSTYFLQYTHRMLGNTHKTASDADADDHIRFPVAMLSTSLASALPVLVVVVLYFVTSTGREVGYRRFFQRLYLARSYDSDRGDEDREFRSDSNMCFLALMFYY
jgi:hypothetical protein